MAIFLAGVRRGGRGLAPILAIPLALACDPPPAGPLPPGSFAFAVFGDGPYYAWEQGRWDRVLEGVRESRVEWLLHVGDIFWAPCSDEAMAERRRDFDSLGLPVIYTPGDNEWADCHRRREGAFDPLDRLAAIRRTFFEEPGRSFGSPSIPLRSQATDPAFAEFPENVLWMRGGFLFATVHVVGGSNGRMPFAGRTAAHDAEVERRTAAAMAWIDHAFAAARAADAAGVFLAMHGDLGPDWEYDPRENHKAIIDRIHAGITAWDRPVVLIHGDSHTLLIDHPLLDPVTGVTYANFTRLETFGSPDIGWVRVVIDSVAGTITAYEPRLLHGWW
jgi:hypothetical protein